MIYFTGFAFHVGFVTYAASFLTLGSNAQSCYSNKLIALILLSVSYSLGLIHL
jgi:hypothetical protein